MKQTAPRTIAIIDDEHVILDSLNLILTSMGYATMRFTRAQHLLDYCVDNPRSLDLFILDMGLPGMDGLECFTRLKELDPKARVIISTGYINDSRTEQAMNLGAMALLEKPFVMQSIATVITKVLKGERVED